MAINRLAISNASANTDTVLYTAVRNCLTSVIATNKSNSQSLIRIWIVPSGQSGDSTKWMHIAYDSIVTGNNSLETFRFPLENGDLVYVRADSANISFSLSGIYENSGAQKVYYDSTAPGAPSIGDIWVNSGASYANTNTSAVIAYQAAEPTTKSPNLLWVDSSGNNTVYANQTGYAGTWSVNALNSSVDPLSFNINGVNRATLTTSGFATETTNSNKLAFSTETFVADGANVAHYGMTMFNNGTTGVQVGFAGWQGLRFYSAGSNRMIIDVNGNVGIGTTSSTGKLHISTPAVESGTYIPLRLTSTGTPSSAFTWSSSAMASGMTSGMNNIHMIGQAESVRNSGYIGYRWSSAGSTSNLLTFGHFGVDNVVNIDGNGYLLAGYTSSNGAYRLQVNSQIFATSSTIATSDGRYKENVNNISGGLDIIDSLRPVSFDWKEHEIHNFPEGKTIGFIAQEVKESLKDYEWVDNLVKTNYNEETEEEFLGIAEGNIIPLLVSAVKELRAEVNTLKEQLNG
jgi:hypothetical protein